MTDLDIQTKWTNYVVDAELMDSENLYSSRNQAEDLVDYESYLSDTALRAAVLQYGGGWGEEKLRKHGKKTGSATVMAWGDKANKNKPELQTYDRRGNRIDLVHYDDAYHKLMALSTAFGTHSSPWVEPRSGAHVVRAAHAYLQTQVDAGHECPIGMTYSCIPSIRLNERIGADWIERITRYDYDGRNIPFYEKKAVTIGMGMTEKQGGSDVRTNITIAKKGRQGEAEDTYYIYGHKWFTSAPMCDAFLILARTAKGIGCFLVPRWRENGQKNQIEIQRLKEKVGNVSNASSELVFRGAMGWQIGEEGRGIGAIMKMVALTRLDCMIQGAGGQRQAIAQAVNHCKGRSVFGATLIDQPLMRNVLADMQLEMEGEMALLMRMAKAMDSVVGEDQDEDENLFARIGLAVGKYWITKRTTSITAEAMECLGGNGATEEFINARLYRDAPINAIWEGAGNVQAIDIKRAIRKSPRILDVWMTRLEKHIGAHDRYDREINNLKKAIGMGEYSDYDARRIIESMAITMQAALLMESKNDGIAELYMDARLKRGAQSNYGTLPKHRCVDELIERADPRAREALGWRPSGWDPLQIDRDRREKLHMQKIENKRAKKGGECDENNNS